METNADHSEYLARSWVEDLQTGIGLAVEGVEARIANSVRRHMARAERAETELKLAREEIGRLEAIVKRLSGNTGKTGSEEG